MIKLSDEDIDKVNDKETISEASKLSPELILQMHLIPLASDIVKPSDEDTSTIDD